MFHDRCVGTIPLNFLETAQINNWTYIRYVLQALVRLPTNFAIVHGGIPVSGNPQGSRYEIVTQPDTMEITFQQGPQGKSLSRAQRDTDTTSTVSASSRVTERPSQAKFREALVARDGRCVVTGSTRFESVTACHIVPQSLGQLYLDEITGTPNEVLVFSPRNGLLLSEMLHKSFDRYRWGIYHKDGNFYLHSFDSDPSDPTSSRFYHGRRLLLNKTFGNAWPHLALIDWHYRQCLMARVRGFAAGTLY